MLLSGQVLRLVNSYQQHLKHQKHSKAYLKFEENIDQLFDIAYCKCVTSEKCKCDKFNQIPISQRSFIADQRGRRQQYLQAVQTEEIDDEMENVIETSSEEEFDFEEYVPNNEISLNEKTTKKCYQKLESLLHFATECDRYSISDRAAAALGTALLKDLNVTNKNNEAIIIDKHIVRKNRDSNRVRIEKETKVEPTIKTFSFDGKRNCVLMTEKKGNVLHPRKRNELNIIILKEPESLYLGYAVSTNTEKSVDISNLLIQFFSDKKLNIDNLYGVLCDGEPKNTGKKNGIIRHLEITLKRPLHWFICLLHFNELPFRHLFDKIDNSVTTGPKTSTGMLAKAIENVDKPVRFILLFNIY